MAELTVGDLIWAKMKGYPVWPGKVVYPPTSLKPRKHHKYIFFFGTNNYSWIPEKNIFGYAENFEKFSTKTKTASFRRAVDAIVKFADEGTGCSSDSDQFEEDVFTHNVPEMTRSQPIELHDSEEERIDNAKNIQEYLISSGTSSVPTISYDDANEGVRESAKQRTERIHERLRQLREAREAELGQTRMLEKRNKEKQSKSAKRVSSNNKSGRKKKAKLEHKYIAEKPEETSSSEAEVIKNGSKNSENEWSTELPVPLTHIKIESDDELLDSFVDTELFKRPIILAEKPKRLGYMPPNVFFRSSIVASRKAAHAAAKIQASQQITEEASQDTCPLQIFPQISALESSEKQDTLTTMKTPSPKEVIAESVELQLQSNELHPKGLPSHVVPFENTRIPVVVISKEEKEICEEKKAELTRAIRASVFIIGFVGLGAIGKAIVKHLLRTNHKIHVHLPDRNECKYFANLGARAFTSPSAIVRTSNVTFLCVDDSDAARHLINSDDGIHAGFTKCRRRRKNFVNMTCMNPETLDELENEMHNKNVRYLQAEIVEGSERQTEQGRLTIICSGSQTLYNKCLSLFNAISKEKPPPLLGCKAKDAATMEILYHSFVGTIYVGLHEALTSVESFGLDKKKFVNVLKDTAMYSSGIIDIATEIVNHGLTSVTGISLIEEKMIAALNLSNEMMHRMHALAAAHDVFKHVKYRVR